MYSYTIQSWRILFIDKTKDQNICRHVLYKRYDIDMRYLERKNCFWKSNCWFSKLLHKTAKIYFDVVQKVITFSQKELYVIVYYSSEIYFQRLRTYEKGKYSRFENVSFPLNIYIWKTYIHFTMVSESSITFDMFTQSKQINICRI